MSAAILATNPKARFDYEILDKYEAGLVLLGHEVKSAKAGNISLRGAYAALRKGEAWLLGARIAPYAKAGRLPDYDPERPRKLLLRKKELKILVGRLQGERLTLVPLKVYTKGRRLKIEIGLGRGKRKYEKRETIKKKEIQREVARAMRRKD